MANRTAIHEAGHTVVGDLFGLKSRGVSVRRGKRFGGCSFWKGSPLAEDALDGLDVSLPFVCWPAGARTWMERRALTWMAGHVAADLLAPVEGRQADPVSEQATQIAMEAAEDAPPPTEEDLAKFAEAVNNAEGKTDEEWTADLARVAHGGDLMSLATWLAFMETQTRALVLSQEARIRRLAAFLEVEEALSGEQVAAILKDPA